MDGCGIDMPDNPKFDGQTWTCQTPNWPKEECKDAVASTHKNGQCMYLHKEEDNRCDWFGNTKKDQK